MQCASAASRLLLLLALSASCGVAGADSAYRRVRSLAEIRHEGVVIQKWDLSCGAAALATLLTYDLGHPITEREVATAMLHRVDPVRVRRRGGFSFLNMQEYAETLGYRAEGYGELSLEDLAQRLPAIVPVNFHGDEHFIVVREVRQEAILAGDPAYGRRMIPIEKFKAAWTSRLAFVVSRP